MSTRARSKMAIMPWLSLESLSGVEGEPVKTDEMTLEIGGADTLPAFTENLRGVTPGEEREFEVAYPEDYGSARLAGKTVNFRATLKGIRRKELPELNDEFAQDLGDYRDLGRACAKPSQRASSRSARTRRSRKPRTSSWINWWMPTSFPVPEAFVERQIRNRVEQSLRAMAGEGIDPSNIKLDWEKVKETQRDKALREVKASHAADRELPSASRFTPPATRSIRKSRRSRGSSGSRSAPSRCALKRTGR